MSKIHKTILKSGIRVITEEMPDAESCSVGIWVNAGSRNETKGVNGISHFIEHMLFKGTQRRTALDISKEIESVGGVLNAFTGREYTCFYAKVLNKDIARAVDLLSDIFLNSKFDAVEINKEKMVVLQEIKLVEDTPDDLIHDLFAERFWKEHPLGWPVLGSSDTVKSFTREDVLNYYRRHYRRTDGVFITVAGGVSHKKALSLISRTFGEVEPLFADEFFANPAHCPGARIVKKGLEQAHLCMGVAVPRQAHKDRFKVYMLNTVLGSGMSSRLFQEVREKRGLAYSVYSYLNLCKDAGALIVYAGTAKESFAGTVRLVMKEFAKIRRGVSKEELENAKSQLRGSMLLGLETSDSRMSKLARDEIYFGRVVPVKEIVSGIDGVTANGLKGLACSVFSPGAVTLVAMGAVSAKGLPKGLRS